VKPGARILVVDDNADFRQVLAAGLRTRGYLITEAVDGVEALTALAKDVPDLAIVDLDLPKLNGLAFSKSVKDVLPDLPIIMVTGYAQFYSPAEILSVGIDTFLQKPVTMDILLNTIAAIPPTP
jgi:CheY-like chemotaxis protein